MRHRDTERDREMAFAATLSTRRCVPLSTSRTHGPLPCPPKYVEMKPSRGGCALPALFLTAALPAKESSGVLTPIASGSGSDGSISRREAVLQVLSGAGRSLVGTGLACSAATLVEDFPSASASASAAVNDVAAESKPRPQFYDLDGSGGVKALDIREGTGATPQMGDKVR